MRLFVNVHQGTAVMVIYQLLVALTALMMTNVLLVRQTVQIIVHVQTYQATSAVPVILVSNSMSTTLNALISTNAILKMHVAMKMLSVPIMKGVLIVSAKMGSV